MIKVAEFIKRNEAITRAEFEEQFEKTYVPSLLSVMPEIKKYRRNHVITGRRPSGWEPNFDVLSLMWFSDRESLDAFHSRLTDEKTTERFGQEFAFVDDSSRRIVVVDECISEIPEALGPVKRKIVLFCSRRDLVSFEEFRHWYEHGHAVLVEKYLVPTLLRYERNYCVESLTPGWVPDFENITEFWYDRDHTLSSDETASLIRDEEQYMDRGSMRSVFLEEIESERS